MQPYFYVFVRSDIPIEDQACQIAHVCAEAGKRFKYPEPTFLVLLHVENQEALCALAEFAKENRILTYTNFEPDDDLGFTALATEVITGEQRKLFRGFKLWKAA